MGISKYHRGMGFRDLEVFKRDLLAKQSWRLLQFLDSLVARILKEKYFPNEEFLQAQLGRRPSFAWKSIFQANEVLEGGLVRRVGNGENIRIWGDPWLPSLYPNMLYSPHQGWDPEARVSALIDQATG